MTHFATEEFSWMHYPELLRDCEKDKNAGVLTSISEQQASFHTHEENDLGEGVLSPNDCVRCSLLLRACKATHCPEPRSHSYDDEGRFGIYPRIPSLTKEPNDSFEIFTVPGSPTLEYITVRALPSGYTGSQAALAFVQKQIRTCVGTHALCGGPNAQPLPTRLIDFRDPTRVHLWETKGARGRYAALSYCWGLDQNLKTTSATYLAHKNKILEIDLPKTFQDALDVCRKLDIGLIWIDSLCILQDSQADWQIESAKMEDVYSNAFITLAASASQSSHGGCYHQQQLHSHKIAQVCEKGDSIDVFARKAWDHLVITWQPLAPGARKSSPLQLRAWAFQERLLAARMIHFTTNEIMWECREMTICECLDEVPRYYFPKEMKRCTSGERGSVKDTFVSLSSAHKIGTVESLRGWKIVVQEYSQLALTKPTDRLPALSGITAKLDKKLLGRYYAGLWEHCFPYWLCWYIRHPMRQGPIILNPSWSWCCVRGKVKFPWNNIPPSAHEEGIQLNPPGLNSTIAILSIDCEAAGPNPYGHVSAGSITVKGELFQPIVSFLPQSPKLGFLAPPLLFDNKKFYCFWDHDQETMRELGIPNSLYCFRVLEECWIVLECVDEMEYIYRRRGCIHYFEGLGETEARDALVLAERKEIPTAREVFERTITII